jgi:predicted cupin superfamily sugar epimerase
MNNNIQQLITTLKLEPLPVEGTLYRNTYRSTVTFSNGDPAGTAIIGLYCHQPESISRFHRLTHDEIWHFYKGDPFTLYLLYPDGSSKEITMGQDILAGQHLQFTVPAKVWQAARLNPDGEYALFGCTMAPGFTGSCFEGTLKKLLQEYPDKADIIQALAVKDDETKMPEGFVN